jgi:hypothetical protein
MSHRGQVAVLGGATGLSQFSLHLFDFFYPIDLGENYYNHIQGSPATK